MPTEIEIQITPLFSTPLLVFTPAHHERINAELSQLILAREASVPSHRDAEVIGWSSPHDLSMMDWAGSPLRELFAPVIEVAKQVTTLSDRCRHAARRPDWEVVEVWASVQRNGGTNAAHSTPEVFGQASIMSMWARSARPWEREANCRFTTREAVCRVCWRPISSTA